MGAGGSAGDAFQLWPAGALLVVKVLSAEPVLWRSNASVCSVRTCACLQSSVLTCTLALALSAVFFDSMEVNGAPPNNA